MVGLSGGPAAFNRDTIVDTRWLVGGLPKLTNGAWYQILQMTPFKQELFLQRLFHLHDISTRRAGKASLVRLSPDQFSLECDRMCLQAFILEQMEATPDSFTEDTVQKIRLGMIEGKLILYCCGMLLHMFKPTPLGIKSKVVYPKRLSLSSYFVVI